MNSRWLLLLGLAAGWLLSAQNSADQPSTRPPGHNDDVLRPLTPEEIAPNLNFYAIDPLYKPGVSLGWARERIEEKLNRGVSVIQAEAGKVQVSWRLLREDPADIAFNLYRGAAKLNAQPLRQTTDFLDTMAPLDRENVWTVRSVVNGRELPSDSSQAVLTANSPVSPYRGIRLKEDIRNADRVAIGDLNGDGTYDFIVKHPGGGVDPGRIRPSANSYKLDAYDGATGRFLWRKDLGWNINQGIWFSPMIVRDLMAKPKSASARPLMPRHVRKRWTEEKASSPKDPNICRFLMV